MSDRRSRADTRAVTNGAEAHHPVAIDVNVLLAWVNAPDWAQSQAFLDEHVDLVGEPGIAELHRQATRQPRAVQVLMLDDHAWLLQLCRTAGISGGYARYEAVVAASRRCGQQAEQAERRFAVSGDAAALDEAMRRRREILDEVQDGSRSRVRAAHLDYGRIMMRSYLRGGNPTDLDTAIEALTTAWEVPGAVVRTQAPITELLSRAMRMRYEHHGAPDDLDRCIAVLDETLQQIPDDSSALPGLLGACGEALRLRHRLMGTQADLDRAVECFERAEDWIADLVARRPARLGDLGTGLVERYQLGGNPADLDRAVMAFDGARAATSEGSPDRAAHLINLGNALLLRFGHSSNMDDLHSAMTHLAHADRELPVSSPLRHALHQGLASGLGVLHEQTNDAADLDRAIGHAESAIALGPPTTAASELANLGQLLVARAERSAESDDRGVTDLDRAVAAFERALNADAPTAPGRAGRLVGLASALAVRYPRTGSGADLDRAVELLRAACAIEQGPNAPGAHLDLGNVLWIRYGRSRRLDDLDEALVEWGRAEAGMPQASADRPGCLNSRAVGLAERFGRQGCTADLGDCVAALRRAAATAPADGPDRLVIMVNLGNALRVQALVTSSPQVRDEAAATLRSALEDARRTGTAQASAAYNLAAVLLTATADSPPRVDVDEAVALMRTASDLVGDTGIDAPRYRAALGRALHARCRAYGPTSADVEQGLAAYSDAAAGAVDVDLELALRVARQWAGWLEEEGGRGAAAPAYRVALSAARRLVAEQALVEHKSAWLRDTVGLHADAASCFATAEDPTDTRAAAVALESGRALLLSDELGIREADVDRLDREQPALGRRYRAAVARLRIAANPDDRTARLFPAIDGLP